jgi:aromatic ring-cleaving dioxygenase
MKFHSHAYFDHGNPADVAEARAYKDLIEKTFAGAGHVEVHSLIPSPVGPHPRGSFEVLFRREAFADYVPWLMLTRPPAIDILIHPLTGSQVLDHTARALWLGRPLELDTAMLAAVDAAT